MGALGHEVVADALSSELFTEASACPGEVDARRLEAAWSILRDALAERLPLDEELQAASQDFEVSLKAFGAAPYGPARVRAGADLRHHAALLDDLLASSSLFRSA